MDWDYAIDLHRETLKRVLAMLVAMAGLAINLPLSERRGRGGGGAGEGSLGDRPTLPRHLHRAVLTLLRPAEAAARRLVIVVARGLGMPSPARIVPSQSAQQTAPAPFHPPMAFRPAPHPGRVVAAPMQAQFRAPVLSLFDPPRRWRFGRAFSLGRTVVPRISVPGYSVPALVKIPSPDDPVSAEKLAWRFAALAAALDDLPKQARRFARWRARARAGAAARLASGQGGKPRRVWPLKVGRPPGWSRKPAHPVHQVLNDLHGLALWALERRDTS